MTSLNKKHKVQVGAQIELISGNFYGHKATITEVDWNSKHPKAIYGYLHLAKLEDGRIVNIEKFEHLKFI
ncbi:hypothetical protein [Leadbetterella byssophila]|uniref:hypothetical protein n=1 Tax=Leadbetterella byssophila TaxID=316068 RepID=UPI0039A39609